MKVALGFLLLSCLLLFVCLVEGGKNKKNAAGENGDNACLQSIKKKPATKRKICDLESRLQILESEKEQEEEEEEETELVGQWVQQVTGFSTEYNTGGWSAAKVVGEPDVYPRYGDLVGTWAQASRDNEEYVEVRFAASVVPKMFSIYETYNAGGVDFIQARTPDGNFETIVDFTPQVITHARIFNVTIPNASFAADTYRIYVNCVVGGPAKWVEIDAIKLFS